MDARKLTKEKMIAIAKTIIIGDSGFWTVNSTDVVWEIDRYRSQIIGRVDGLKMYQLSRRFLVLQARLRGIV